MSPSPCSNLSCRERAAFLRLLTTIVAATLLVSSLRADPPELPMYSPSPKPAATPARKASPAPSPPPEHRAPTGVLYLTEDTTLPLQYGLEGLAAGTTVKLVKETGDTVLVDSAGRQFTMKKTQVTDDLDVAAAVQKRTAAIEAADEAARQQQEAVFLQQQRDQIEFLRTHPLATPTPTPRQ